MSSTTTTQFYGLTQYIGNDKPDFADNNTAFRNIDADLHQVVQDSQGFSSDIAGLTETVGNLNTDLTNLSGDLDGEKAKIVALQNKELSQDGEIERVERNAQDMIVAYNEASATSTHAYAVGDYFIYNNVLYKATAAIAIGATIVPDTNCTTTNVTSELIQLNNDLSNSSAVVPSNVNLTLKSNEANIITRCGGLTTVVVGFTISDTISATAELFNIPESMLKRATRTEDIYLPCTYYVSGNPNPIMLHLNAETGKVYCSFELNTTGDLLISATFPNNY